MNIVIVNNLPRFPDTPRWDFELVRYEDFIDHDEHTVSYLVNQRGLSGVTAPAGSYNLYLFDSLSDADAYRPVLDAITQAEGQIDRLIVFSEGLQDVVAQLRGEYDIPGNGPEQNRLGRDKLVMKEKVAAAGLRVPRFTSIRAGQVDDALAFAVEAGYPLILKPVDGQSSAGVQKLDNEAQLRAAITALPAQIPHDLEEFIDGELFHVDGLINAQGQVNFVVPSRYVNTCLDFTFGAPLGAAMIAPGSELYEAVCRFSVQCIEAIGLRGCPFHLELFHSRHGELVFLEVGARVGGADVPYVIDKTTGVNLFGEWLRMIMGEEASVLASIHAVGGWLMFPRPDGLPLRVEAVSDFEGQLASLYRQLVPQLGEVIEHEEGYCSMQSGRFLFCADSAERVEQDMQRVMREFSIRTVAV
ncbi:ATP-grasp domain-containing protein [Andreprevotia chitinilytica]|uniref:ATP-grasp domain-containing protein n=1 Tax=Andreprevotia chitinilytica TaxID=396808 RepID=UPI00055281E9|nr:ATP-grasp domain-containing protein [Andreprevotia chitinilytica]